MRKELLEGLTPLLNVVSEMVELLRQRVDTDYSSMFDKVQKIFSELKA